MAEKQNIEALLEHGHTVQISPQGYSMYPLFLPGRDEAVIAPLDSKRLKRGDVALYRREGGILVLHRVWRRSEGRFYAVGDHQREIEGPLEASCAKGILIGVVRKGRFFSVGHPVYWLLSGIWLWLRPMRPCLFWIAARVKDLVSLGKSSKSPKSSNKR